MKNQLLKIIYTVFGLVATGYISASPFEPILVFDLGPQVIEQRSTTRTDKVTCYHKRVPCFTYGVPRINE